MASSAAISTQAFRPVDWRRTAHILNAPNRAKCQLRENRGNLQFLKSISDVDASEGHSLALERTWEGWHITSCAHFPLHIQCPGLEVVRVVNAETGKRLDVQPERIVANVRSQHRQQPLHCGFSKPPYQTFLTT